MPILITLTISAAASMGHVLKDLGSRYEASHPGVKLQYNVAASGVLLQQIAQGAPVDVFISADEATMSRGVGQKLLDASSRRDIASNQVVLIVPQPSEVSVSRLTDLGQTQVKRVAIGKVASVPAGRYSQQALEHAKLWGVVTTKLVYADSVRQVLDYVARGEVDAGFVYATDASLVADKVKVVQRVEGHEPVRYPAAVISASRHKAAAHDFVSFLLSAPAQAVFAQAGFGKP